MGQVIPENIVDPIKFGQMKCNPPEMIKNNNEPIQFRARSDPGLVHHSRGDPPLLFSARGDPLVIKSTRDGPMIRGLNYSNLTSLARLNGGGIAEYLGINQNHFWGFQLPKGLKVHHLWFINPTVVLGGV